MLNGGQSNLDTRYFRAWRDTVQHIVADISNGYWEEEGKVPAAMLRNTNKAKTGQLWHKGKAYLWKMPYMRGGPVAIDNLWANQTLGAPFSEVVHTLK